MVFNSDSQIASRQYLNTEKIVVLLLSILLFFLLKHLITMLIPGFWKVDLHAWLDHRDRIQIYWQGPVYPVSFSEKISRSTGEFEPHQEFRTTIGIRNANVETLRLDLGDYPGVSRIYKLTLRSHFSNDVILTPEEIYQSFKPARDGVSIERKPGYVEIKSVVEDPHIVSTVSLVKRPGPIYLYVLPVLLAAIFYRTFNFRIFDIVGEIRKKKPSHGLNIDALDGLRGLAALMVIADHTMGFFRGVGASGVWIFFALSGFLLAKPFVAEPGLIVSRKYMDSYFVKRIRRILPMYYAYIFFVFVVPGKFGEAIRHFLFIQGNGHLWAIPQEVLFYLVAPFILLLSFGLFRGRPNLVVPLLIILILVSNEFLGRRALSLIGMNFVQLPFFLGTFLSGMLFSYFHFGIYSNWEPPAYFQKYSQVGFALLAIILLMGFCLFSTGRLIGSREIYAQSHPGWFGMLAGLIIWSVIVSRVTLLGRFFSALPLRAIGLVGLSIYLVHPIVIMAVKKFSLMFFGYNISGLFLFFSTVLISYLLSCITYKVIEQPFTIITPAKTVA
jgi:peptidoglycan/LPS O-acetylase OafA/YrhL